MTTRFQSPDRWTIDLALQLNRDAMQNWRRVCAGPNADDYSREELARARRAVVRLERLLHSAERS